MTSPEVRNFIDGVLLLSPDLPNPRTRIRTDRTGTKVAVLDAMMVLTGGSLAHVQSLFDDMHANLRSMCQYTSVTKEAPLQRVPVASVDATRQMLCLLVAQGRTQLPASAVLRGR